MLQQMCRTCLATCGDLVPIFSNDYYVHDLSDKLLHTIMIEVLKDDKLPKMMCKKCIFLVDSLYCFKDQCKMAEIKLKKLLNGDNDYSLLNKSTCSEKVNEIQSPVQDNLDPVSSSEEEYQIEYASEEARIEVENARRQSRNAKKKTQKSSGVKVKSVEILPKESKNNIYRNLRAGSPYRHQLLEIPEDANVSDSDDRSSLNAAENITKLTTKNLDVKYFRDSFSSTSEKIEFYKNLKSEKFQEKLSSFKPGFKRKFENDNSYNQLTKVPKKVMFKENDFDDENMQFIEVTDNNVNKICDGTSKIFENDFETHMQLSIIENSPGKVVSNSITADEECNISKNLPTSLDYELQKKSPNTTDSKKIFDFRIHNIIKHFVLNIPEVCTICLEHFESYTQVLKHKIEAHFSTDEKHCLCPICHKQFSKNYISEHLNQHTGIRCFICVLCSDSFYTEETLRTHLESHVDVHDLKCHMCSKQFPRIQALLSHVEQHLSIQLLSCVMCSDSFNNKDCLQNHVDQQHTRNSLDNKFKFEASQLQLSEKEEEQTQSNATNYPCPYCESIFSVKTSLRDHVFTHLGVPQFSCLVCEKAFGTQEERTKHMQDHMKPQPKIDRKKFRCRVCHEILVSRIAYGQHLKEKHWNAKQTSEILKELAETSISEKVNEQFNKSLTSVAADCVSST